MEGSSESHRLPADHEESNERATSKEHKRPVKHQASDDEDDLSEAHKDDPEAEAILQSLLAGKISVQVAAEHLASLSLKHNDFEKSVLSDWSVILECAKKSTDHHHTLSKLLVTMASLPPERDDRGNQLNLRNGRFWDDLPRFRKHLYEEWQRSEQKETYMDVVKFAAQLKSTQHPVFASLDWWSIVAMRDALEHPKLGDQPRGPEFCIPEAVIWVSGLGPEMYSWENEFPYGRALGDRGGGGPLWKGGKHGFCKERWNLWKQRFLELSLSDELSEELRKLAAEGARKMIEAETKAA